ncbi:MAG: lysine biosynthesis protein LysX [Planctomycetota bacterium]
MRIAMTSTRLRTEERLLLDAFEDLGIEVEPIDSRAVAFDPMNPGPWAAFDAVIDRSVSLTSTLTAVRILEGYGLRCINALRVIGVCSDKLLTTLALAQAGVPQPDVRGAVNPDAGLEAVEAIGYPAVLKPTVGSWGRLVARLNDRDAAEAVLEHRDTLGSAQQGVFYVQEHVNKPDRDIRVFVVGGEPIAAIVRHSAHWVTNTARGATAEGLELTDELRHLAVLSADSVGADVVAVDLLECPKRGLLVNELNHSMEFRNSITTTGVDIPRFVAEHAARIAEGATA